jgi:hypothetical protein
MALMHPFAGSVTRNFGEGAEPCCARISYFRFFSTTVSYSLSFFDIAAFV